jgi:dephospho-CoA kinase
MKLLGLTGDIASGKSSVAALLQKRGAHILDADALVHELYDEPEFAGRVASLFGPGVLSAEKTIARRALGAIVFNDEAALKRLENLVHPAVAVLREDKLRALKTQNPAPIVVLEAVKLLESGQARGCAAVWCVICAPEIQLQRLMQKRGLSEDAARARISSQPPREEKRKLAAASEVPLLFIENNGTPCELEKKVEILWREFLKIETPETCQFENCQ